MPCWYYSKKDLKNTPSLRDGIDTATETRYRREGARFIIDTGTKMGLRYDTCATGVVYFHRFYMFHSFREFHRYVTSACCLFLAGKVEETPKKCKDIIKITSSMLTDEQFMVFGKDPKEEIMTLERILLQTMKFDLQVEHPYAYLLKFAKIIKGDKAKIQKMVQMAWTFINDSLCTMLCLQWESDIVGVALIYLAGRLTKYDINDWVGKQPGVRIKWYEHLVEDVTLELLEDICHQVLDLYSPSQQKRDDSPPPPPPPRPSNHPPSMTHNLGQPPGMTTKRARSPSTGRAGPPGQPTPAKSSRRDGGHSKSPGKKDTLEKKLLGATKPGSTHGTPGSAGHPLGYTSNNPYVNSQMYSSSFMSQEGAQSIQTLVGNTPATAAAPPAPPFSAYNPAVPPPVPAYSQPPPAVAPPTASSASQPQTTAAQYSQQGGYPASGYPPGYQAQGYQASQYQQPVQQQGAGYSHSQQTGQQYQNTSYGSQSQHSQSQSQYSHYGQQYQQQYPNQQQQPQQQPQQQQQSQYANQYSGQQQYAQSGQPYSSYSNQNYGHTQQGQGYQPPPPGTHQQQYQS